MRMSYFIRLSLLLLNRLFRLILFVYVSSRLGRLRISRGIFTSLLSSWSEWSFLYLCFYVEYWRISISWQLQMGSTLAAFHDCSIWSYSRLLLQWAYWNNALFNYFLERSWLYKILLHEYFVNSFCNYGTFVNKSALLDRCDSSYSIYSLDKCISSQICVLFR